jgi:hypothetical protein
MKIFCFICGCSAILFSQFAAAKLPITAEALGKTEAVVAFCSQVNPKDAALYKEAAKGTAGEASEKELADARASKEYKEAVIAMRAELAKLSKEDALAACTVLSESRKK